MRRGLVLVAKKLYLAKCVWNLMRNQALVENLKQLQLDSLP